MNRIRDWLYIGSYRDTRDLGRLRTYNIGAMLQLAEWVEQPEIVSLYLQVKDGEPLPEDKLKEGVAFVRQQKANEKPILIACGAGISRSATYVMAVLMEEEGLDFFEAYRSVSTHHPDALPHPELCQSLAAYHGIKMELIDFWERIITIQKETHSNP